MSAGPSRTDAKCSPTDARITRPLTAPTRALPPLAQRTARKTRALPTLPALGPRPTPRNYNACWTLSPIRPVTAASCVVALYKYPERRFRNAFEILSCPKQCPPYAVHAHVAALSPVDGPLTLTRTFWFYHYRWDLFCHNSARTCSFGRSMGECLL